MSTGELLLTILIALLVFGPERLPIVARQLGTLMKRMNHYKQQFFRLLEAESQEQQLQNNLKKAEKADQHYQS